MLKLENTGFQTKIDHETDGLDLENTKFLIALTYIPSVKET